MADFKDDIKKYRNGELSSAEMHALEKKALSDPFFADALEGAESISSEDFSVDVSEIDQQVSSKAKKTVWFTPLRIAAGMVLLIGSIFLIYNFNKNDEQFALQKEETISPTVTEADDSTAKNNQPELLSLNRAKDEPKTEIIADQKATHGPTAKSAEGSGETKPVAGISSSSQAEPTPAEQTKSDQVAAAELSEIMEDEKTEEKEKIAAAPVQHEFKKEVLDKDIVSGARARKSVVADDAELREEEKLQRIVSGQVTSLEDGLPVPGVNVRVKGTTNATVTDMQGNYSIPIGDEKQLLVFSFIGLQTSEVSPSSKSTVNVKLLEDAAQLSEVVVTGQGVKSDQVRDETPVIKLAEPIGGRKTFDKYLENNLRYPKQALENKIKGKVTIEFAVRADGSLSGFNVVKSLGYGCDEELMRLVKEGPKWSPTTEGNVAIESNIRVKLKFDPSKVKK